MRAQFDTAELRCYTGSYTSREHFRMNCRSTTLAKDTDCGGGFETRGLLFLALCGLYAVFLFSVARLFSAVTFNIMSSVKSVFWKIDVREISCKPVYKDYMDNKNNATLKHQINRLQPRTVSHG